nr:transmembrane and ubiquitin-like domain-containing protein 1 [Onthophagus taurus]
MFYKLLCIDEFFTEFTHLFVAIIIVSVVLVAWRSTNTPDNRQIRAVYVFDRRFRRNRHIPRLTNHTVATTLVESTQETVETPQNNNRETISTQTVENTFQDDRQNLIKKMDADNNVIRQRRLAFFNKTNAETNREISQDGASSSNQTTSDPEPSAPFINETQQAPPTYGFNLPNVDSNNIKIKLKYLNDELKSVDAKLNESLKDFKQRHFSTEMAENKRIKLIFNGHLLQREEETLEQFGLFDNCVVHCLIHQTRPVLETGSDTNSSRSGRRNGERDWDLGNLLLVLVSVLLSLAWYTRYNYPQLFTITSTVGLVIITLLFGIISLGMFFPDQNVPNIEVHLR